eukprot:scaffold241258_cov14-Tisochrysis_lutea.AAC.1
MLWRGIDVELRLDRFPSYPVTALPTYRSLYPVAFFKVFMLMLSGLQLEQQFKHALRVRAVQLSEI